MVKHQPLQVYERQLCLSCLTGIYGCRWKRYQRSHDDTTKWECVWFLILIGTFSLLLVWLYFWVEARNDYNEFNWSLYNKSGEWNDGTITVLTMTAAGFTYTAFLMVLALGHIALGQQLNLHWMHKIGVTAALLTTVVGMISVGQTWGEEWDIIAISLQATGPFLHIGAVIAVTALAWLIAGQVARAERMWFQAALLLFYAGTLLTLYLVPLGIKSPCIMNRGDLKTRPAIIGHQGAPMLAPENTMMAFQKAIQLKVSGLETDVTISVDGVPFLLRDRTLRRTTDVKQVFPDRQFDAASMFNWTDLQALNAGQWFIKDNPFWTVGSLSKTDLVQAENQSLCSLEDFLELAAGFNCSVVFRLQRPPPGHPHHMSWINDTLETVLSSGIQQELVMWTPDKDRKLVRKVAPGFQQTSTQKQSPAAANQGGISRLLLRYNWASARDVRVLFAHNVSLTLYTVNKPWLYSVLWCSGVPSVSSDAPHILNKVPYPIWLMTPDEYCISWVITDLVSIITVVGIFVFQKWRMSGIRSYNPEQIMLSAAVRRSSRDVNIMKEKLIFSELSNGVGSTEELYAGNGYDRYTNDGVAH
ncbi:glycerophosphodiester phosphodiesterase domain-containing protein 5 isoform X2 [Brienomyrus brachyistius]|uniref:glycerophosphodiester phosphodiesterase domain-containing protein 5 isoform X2 n=1 Tax=Brienomyrus brachyistius TaxID=42636 RepID=UPI0020B1EF30|nr:glycerophosphodiester phosphodiesterase domain-containing protein 5 isoform X2 [Brienomyrus brachyistius]